MKQLYLKESVQAEPLTNQWYVTLPMLAPAQAALLIANNHLRIIQSYLDNPDIHYEASKDPSLIGSPFMNLDSDRSEEIQILYQDIVNNKKHLLDFADAIKKLDFMLQEEATGYSLTELYKKIPDILDGYVELVYDINSNPSFRLIEGLLYKSNFYNINEQSFLFHEINSDYRTSVLSTPRLVDNNEKMQVHMPFADRIWDSLFKMREHAANVDDIIENLEISKDNKINFMQYFTETPPIKIKQEYNENNIRIRYFGHACLLIQAESLNILTDPLISYKYTSDCERYTFNDLPKKIDYVLITHAHLDHLVLETLLQLRYKIKHIVIPKNTGRTLVEPSVKLLLNNLGFDNVIEIDEMDDITSFPIKIMGVPFLGEHHDLNIQSKIAYLLNIHGKKIYIAADSANLSPSMYRRIHEITGDIDVLFLGMECHGAPLSWFYGHLLTRSLERTNNNSRRGSGSDFEQAKKIVSTLNCKAVYIYAMGIEPWFSYILDLNYEKNSVQIVESDKLLDYCRNQSITAERLYAIKEIYVPIS